MRTEEDIRAALRTLAREAPDADAVLSAVRDKLARASTDSHQDVSRKLWRWLAPLGAAAVVIAVIAAAVALGGMQRPRHEAAASPALRRLPQYYMTMMRSPAAEGLAWAGIVVKSTRTGASLLTARPPAPYSSFRGIAGASDDRTFVLAAQEPVGPPQDNVDITKLFRARLDPSKRTLTMTPLPIPVFRPPTFLDGIALSPDGTEVAVVMQTGKYQKMVEVSLYSLTGKLLRIWHSRGLALAYGVDPALMSWTRTGVLAINWASFVRQNDPRDDRSGLWLLNTASASGSLRTESQLVVRCCKELNGFSLADEGVVTGDGATVLNPMIRSRSVTQTLPDGLHSTITKYISEKIQEFSAATGQPTGALWWVRLGRPDTPTALDPDEMVLWSNASGSVLVVQANMVSGRLPEGKTTIGVVSRNHFTPIPGTSTPRASYVGVVF
jgi:hypothetical protein